MLNCEIFATLGYLPSNWNVSTITLEDPTPPHSKKSLASTLISTLLRQPWTYKMVRLNYFCNSNCTTILLLAYCTDRQTDMSSRSHGLLDSIQLCLLLPLHLSRHLIPAVHFSYILYKYFILNFTFAL